MGKDIHVVPTDDGRWKVKGAGDSRASSVHDKQSQAIEAGRDLAVKNQSELVIHGRDGRIRDKDSFGNDPFPPRDTKQ